MKLYRIRLKIMKEYRGKETTVSKKEKWVCDNENTANRLYNRYLADLKNKTYSGIHYGFVEMYEPDIVYDGMIYDRPKGGQYIRKTSL